MAKARSHGLVKDVTILYLIELWQAMPSRCALAWRRDALMFSLIEWQRPVLARCQLADAINLLHAPATTCVIR